MKSLAIVLAVGAAALLGGSAANAADNAVAAKATTGVTQSPTDISSRGRHWRGHRHMTYRHYRPYYRSYGYAPRPYYYGGGGPAYYGGGPVVSFGFGGGGWGHHHRGW